MPRVNLPIAKGFYLSDSLPISAQECVNWYPNIPQVEGALSAESLFGCPGVSEILTTGEVNQVNRGAHVKDGKPYFLNGTTLIRIDNAFDSQGEEFFTSVPLGTIPGEGRVSMADNGKQLMVLVPGGNGYIIDESSGTPFVQITDAGFTANGNPQLVVFVDSFFVCNTDSKKFIKSASNDGINWSALDFGSAESDPDKINSLYVHNNKLYLGGTETTEEHQNIGAGGFPFQRTGFFLDKGVFAPFSMISSNNTFMWIGGGTNESPAIWALSGNSAQKVSTTAIDSALQDYSQEEIEQAFAYSYAQNGAYFVGFSLPTRTFEYNVITGRWNERKSQIINSKGLTETIRWRVNSIVTAYNRVLCGDSQDGRIGSVEVDTYTEYNNEIIRTVSTQPFSDLGNAITVTQLEATFESGVGDLSTVNPQIRLSTSPDGRSYNNELSRSIGKIGEYFKRSIWNKLGRFPRFAVFKFVMSDPVKPVFIKLEANIRGGQRGN
ncbi:packaged DNA stabilization protein [Pseudoalteromonas sp.]|uniref:packaged DNA stabilization protein n=1 Tax=Pseudoalteromonas sp. TaxID=53249 RepID=UPI003563868E